MGDVVQGALAFFGDASGEQGPDLFGPSDEGRLGHIEAAADGGKAQALGAEPEEFIMGGRGVHVRGEP